MSNESYLSEKHGVNPMMLQCYICGNDAGIALLGKLKDDKEAQRKGAIPGYHCNDCGKILDQGSIIIEVTDESAKNKDKDPYRTGRVIGVKDDTFKQMFNFDSKIGYMAHTEFEKIFGVQFKDKDKEHNNE